MNEIKTLEELTEIEARAASGCSVVGCWEELDDWYIACKEDVPALTAALREAWERIAELEGALAEWYLASDDYAEGAETAAHDHLNELAAECAAKREAKP